ncbi:hypothetical protein [Brevibacillus borstelensis]|uniref:hypothetical protein n=1 Tax=Brevibacillus borstelensis TaxID=45462 RepID=UPI0030C1A110
MDIDQRMTELGKAKREAAMPDRIQLARLKNAIRKKTPKQGVRTGVIPVSLVLCALVVMIGVLAGFPAEQGELLSFQKEPPQTAGTPKNPVAAQKQASPSQAMMPNESGLVVEEKFAFAAELIELVQEYTELEVKKITDSPFSKVFKDTSQAVLLETNRGKVDLVFFPNPGQAEKVEIDEDFAVRGNITFTFTGAELRDGVAPLRAKGPTYQFTHDNLLVLSSNSEFVSDFRNMFTSYENYREVLRNFGLNINEYKYLKWPEGKQKIAGLPEKAAEELSPVWWIRDEVKLRAGDLFPGLFIKRGSVEVVSAYKTVEGIDHLFRLKWDEQNAVWTISEHQSKSGKALYKGK